MNQVREFIEPIKKKWVYHFIISPKTNLIEKPEWYLNQTLKWIYEHIDVVEAKVKLSQLQDSKCNNVKHKFILCMIELAMIRLTKDMKKVSSCLLEDIHSEAILIHTYNEVIQFVKVARRLLDDCYPNLEDQYDMLSVFSNQELFEKIIDIEWEYAEKNLKEITNSLNKWDPVLEGEFVDNYKIPRCVDRLLMLIKSISERVECFRQLDCQFKLIELECYLFNKFLKFLKKSLEAPQSSKNILTDMLFFDDNSSTIDLTRVLRILNGVNFLRLVLKEKFFIPNNVIPSLDKSLMNKSDELATEYRSFFYLSVGKVISIYEFTECDLQKFLNFIKPKLSHHIFEIVKDEASKAHQTRETESLLEGLSLK